MAKNRLKEKPETTAPSEAPSDTNGVEAPLNGQPKYTGTAEKRRPEVSFRFPTDRTTTVEVALWPNEIKLQDGTKAEVLVGTIQRTYKDAQGEYVENRSFRVHDLPVLAHALMKAFAYAMDEREMNGNCPF